MKWRRAPIRSLAPFCFVFFPVVIALCFGQTVVFSLLSTRGRRGSLFFLSLFSWWLLLLEGKRTSAGK